MQKLLVSLKVICSFIQSNVENLLHAFQSVLHFLKTLQSYIVLIRNTGWLYSNLWEDLEVEVLPECNVHD